MAICVYVARLNVCHVGRLAKGDETHERDESVLFYIGWNFLFVSFSIFRHFFFLSLFSVSDAVRSVWVGLKASLRADGENNSKRSSRDTNGMDGKRDGSVKLEQKSDGAGRLAT